MKKTREELSALFSPMQEFAYREDISTEDRIVGAIMGTFIGDALGVGCHWIYDFEELWKDYGFWIDDYIDPKAVNEGGPFDAIASYRYSAGVRAGMNSQTGQLMQVFLETVAADCQKNPQGRFMRDDYVHAVNNFFENTILPEASFDPVSGKISPLSGRYTNEEVRDNFDYWYNKGQKNGRWWYPESNTSPTSTTDIGQTGVILAALYRDPREAFYKGYELLSMWYTDKAYIASQLMYIMTVHAFINNVPIKYYENYLIALFDKIGVIETYINSFDDSMIFVDVFRMLKKEHLFKAVDDRFASILFGTNCHCFNLIPCAYYYSIKNTTNFEKGILTAVNSSGNNMSRAALTGGILGAMNGIQGIPQRFIDGLKTDKPLPENYTSYGQYLMDLAKTVAQKSNGKIPPLELSYESDCGCYVSFD